MNASTKEFPTLSQRVGELDLANLLDHASISNPKTEISIVLLSGCETINTDVPLVLYNEVDPFILEFKEKILYQADVSRINIVSYDSQNSQLNQNEIIDNIFLDNRSLIKSNLGKKIFPESPKNVANKQI